MRLKDIIDDKSSLSESAPGMRGKTTFNDAKAWISMCQNGEASEKDLSLYNQLLTISKKLGGRTTVIEVLRAMN